jgi:hypothetical protein
MWNMSMKIKPTQKYVSKNQKGQALLFAVVAVTIALAIGIGVATRNISSLSRTARTDTSARAFAASEGGIEKLLALPTDKLSGLAGGTTSCIQAGFATDTGTPTGFCSLTYPLGTGATDKISSVAYVKVESYTIEDSEGYVFTLKRGNVKEIALNGTYATNQMMVCWKTPDANPPTAIYYSSYNSAGELLRGALKANGGLGDNDGYVSNEGFEYGDVGDHIAPSAYVDTTMLISCKTVSLVNNAYGLRLMSLFGDPIVLVKSMNGATIPMQGYLLTSLGKITAESGVVASKQIKVIRSLPYMPSFLDFAIFNSKGSVN